MKEVILCYQGEMALKGLNKATFEAALAKALRFRVRELGKFQVYKAQSTMYVEPRDEEERRHLYHAFYQGWHAHAHRLLHPTERHDGWLMLR